MSAAASTPVYFSTTGLVAVLVISARCPFTQPHAFEPYFAKHRVG